MFRGDACRSTLRAQPLQNNKFLPEDTLPSTSRSRGTWELWPPTNRHWLSVTGCHLEQSWLLPISHAPFQPYPTPCLVSPRSHLSYVCQSLQGTRREGPWESWQAEVVGSWQVRGGYRCWGRRRSGPLRWLLYQQHKLGRQIGTRSNQKLCSPMLERDSGRHGSAPPYHPCSTLGQGIPLHQVPTFHLTFPGGRALVHTDTPGPKSTHGLPTADSGEISCRCAGTGKGPQNFRLPRCFSTELWPRKNPKLCSQERP